MSTTVVENNRPTSSLNEHEAREAFTRLKKSINGLLKADLSSKVSRAADKCEHGTDQENRLRKLTRSLDKLEIQLRNISDQDLVSGNRMILKGISDTIAPLISAKNAFRAVGPIGRMLYHEIGDRRLGQKISSLHSTLSNISTELQYNYESIREELTAKAGPVSSTLPTQSTKTFDQLASEMDSMLLRIIDGSFGTSCLNHAERVRNVVGDLSAVKEKQYHAGVKKFHEGNRASAMRLLARAHKAEERITVLKDIANNQEMDVYTLGTLKELAHRYLTIARSTRDRAKVSRAAEELAGAVGEHYPLSTLNERASGLNPLRGLVKRIQNYSEQLQEVPTQGFLGRAKDWMSSLFKAKPEPVPEIKHDYVKLSEHDTFERVRVEDIDPADFDISLPSTPERVIDEASELTESATLAQVEAAAST